MAVKKVCDVSGDYDGQYVLVHFCDFDKTRISDYFSPLKTTRKLVEEAEVGELCRTEFPIDGTEGFLYLNGPDARKIAEIIIPSFLLSTLMKEAEISLLYGSPDDENVREEVIKLV